ncbi:MAG: DUF192 domain-containing protein [Fimbriimonas sp.]
MTLVAAFLIALSPPVWAPVQAKNQNRTFQLKDLAKVDLKANGKVIHAWIMDTEEKRQEGMMFLTDKEVKANEGMLFIFPQPRPLSFWMRNTILPLDIIFLDASGKVLNIGRGLPFDESGVPAVAPGKYVLELKVGQAKAYGIKAGLKFAIPSNLKGK